VKNGHAGRVQRGDIVTVSGAGDYGKPRPAVVVQSNYLTEAGLGSIIVCLIAGEAARTPTFRVTLAPDAGNGLQKTSQVMIDKLVAVRLSRVGKVIGRLDDKTMLQLNRTLAFVVGLAE
jgi:mRNA interferase MazF